MIDTAYLPRPDDHEATIARHLIHHPEDEHHPLMALITDLLDQLDALTDELEELEKEIPG